MMTSRERIKATLNHKQPDKMAVDFGATPVTGIHVLAIENLRKHYGLSYKPIKVTEPYQMLGEVDAELMDIMGVDVIGLTPPNNIFGFSNDGEKEFKTFWGQTVIVPEKFNTKYDENGNLIVYPEGDMSVPPSARMSQSSYFFDAIIRQEPIDDAKLNFEDNLEEFEHISDQDLEYWKKQMAKHKDTDRAIIANFGGTALGDIALVPAPFLKYPKGIRDVTEWYMSTLMRPDYLHSIFDKQTDIAISNMEKLFKVIGNSIDAAFICGTDFGTQDSTFCSSETFTELYKPHYRKMNDWIHANTEWKTFKHSCGAVEPFMNNFIDAGFDIINPVQINAVGMEPNNLKNKYGNNLTFWGGGVDTQQVLPFGTPAEVEKQVLQECEIFSKNGGFVFNSVHNIQANVPVENIAAMVNAVKKFNGE